MSRTPKFDAEQIVGATARLLADHGPTGVTIAAIASALGAPTGSIYHRFTSRDRLIGEAWLRACESFQHHYFEQLWQGAPWEGGLAAALYIPARVRAQPLEARILLLHRRDDFLSGDWPKSMKDRAAALTTDIAEGLVRFTRNLCGRNDGEARRIVRFAVLDGPLGATLPYVQADKAPPASVDAVVKAAYGAVLGLVGAHRSA